MKAGFLLLEDSGSQSLILLEPGGHIVAVPATASAADRREDVSVRKVAPVALVAGLAHEDKRVRRDVPTVADPAGRLRDPRAAAGFHGSRPRRRPARSRSRAAESGLTDGEARPPVPESHRGSGAGARRRCLLHDSSGEGGHPRRAHAADGEERLGPASTGAGPRRGRTRWTPSPSSSTPSTRTPGPPPCRTQAMPLWPV